MASRPHSVQDDLMELRAYLGGHGDIYNVFKRIEEQLQAAKCEADMYRADRDEYDALLGRKMAERDGLREQLDAVSASNAAAATLAGEFSVRVKVLQEQLDATRVALDRGAADYVGLLEQLEEHHRVGYGLNWGEKCPICGPCRSLSEPGSREAEGQAHGSVKGSRVGTGSERERQ